MTPFKIISYEDFKKEYSHLTRRNYIELEAAHRRFCHAVHLSDMILGIIAVPDKNHPLQKKPSLGYLYYC